MKSNIMPLFKVITDITKKICHGHFQKIHCPKIPKNWSSYLAAFSKRVYCMAIVPANFLSFFVAPYYAFITCKLAIWES